MSEPVSRSCQDPEGITVPDLPYGRSHLPAEECGQGTQGSFSTDTPASQCARRGFFWHARTTGYCGREAHPSRTGGAARKIRRHRRTAVRGECSREQLGCHRQHSRAAGARASFHFEVDEGSTRAGQMDLQDAARRGHGRSCRVDRTSRDRDGWLSPARRAAAGKGHRS